MANDLTSRPMKIDTANPSTAVKATALIGAADSEVELERTVAGSEGNEWTVEVVDSVNPLNPTLLAESALMRAEVVDKAVKVYLGNDAGDSAEAEIGAGDSLITLSVDAAGAAGNDYTVEVVDPSPALSLDLDVTLVGTALVITLGTDGAGALDDTKNASDDVATAINAAQTPITATAADVDPLTAAEAVQSFTGGGENVAPDDVKNTGTLIAAAIGALDGLDAAATGTGADPIDTPEGPTAFADGVDDFLIPATIPVHIQSIQWYAGDTAADEAIVLDAEGKILCGMSIAAAGDSVHRRFNPGECIGNGLAVETLESGVLLIIGY